MLKIEISNSLHILKNTATIFMELVESLDKEFPHPKAVTHGDGYVFRHQPNERTDTLASYLKLVRIISLTNACLDLMGKGYIHEVYILCRAIDEASEDIKFFALPLGETGTNQNQMNHLKEFYQEEHENPHDPLSSTSRQRIPRKKIRSASSNIPTNFGDPHTKQKVANSISQLFSGFVHGAYVFIMEMYDKKYHMHGMPNSPRLLECADNFSNHLYRSILALEALCYRIPRHDIAKSAVQLNIDLAEKTGCVDKDGIESLKLRLEPTFLQNANQR